MPEKAAFFHFYSAFCFIPCEIFRLEPSGGCCKPANQPAKRKEDGAGQKYGKAWRIIPGAVDVLANMENGPEQEWTGAKILNNLGSLVGNGRHLLTIGGVGKLIEI